MLRASQKVAKISSQVATLGADAMGYMVRILVVTEIYVTHHTGCFLFYASYRVLFILRIIEGAFLKKYEKLTFFFNISQETSKIVHS